MHNILEHNFAPTLHAHHVEITNIFTAMDPSMASNFNPCEGVDNDDINSTGTASLASLKEFIEISKHFQKAVMKFTL